MQAVREMIKTKSRDCSIRLPEWAVGQELEVIILPSNRVGGVSLERDGESLIERLLTHPLKIKGFSPMTRKSAHER